MGTTHFSGPVASANGFEGDINAAEVQSTSVVTVGLTATGDVILSGLPTTDPEVEGQLWSNLGVLTVSAGA